ncbi:hypothetical protein FQZ97_1017410 [compost metagenome]|jgi:hypothetical protein
MTTTSAERYQPAGQLRRGDGREVSDDVVHPRCLDQRRQVEVPGAAEGTEDGDLQVDVRTAPAEQRSCLDQDLRALEPLDPPGEQEMKRL